MVELKRTTVVINTTFEGVHKFANAPEEVSYLRNMHRHVFHVCVEMEVRHDDREVEFICVRHALDKYLAARTYAITVSCEQIAKDICDTLLVLYGDRAITCTVLEDGENGGRVYYEH